MDVLQVILAEINAVFLPSGNLFVKLIDPKWQSIVSIFLQNSFKSDKLKPIDNINSYLNTINLTNICPFFNLGPKR